MKEIHEYAEFWPRPTKEEYAELKENISKYGFDESIPIILYNDKILDGYTRAQVCEELKVEPHYTTFEGTDAEAFELTKRLNYARRHMSVGQKSLMGDNWRIKLVEINKEKGKENLIQFQDPTGGVKITPTLERPKGMRFADDGTPLNDEAKQWIAKDVEKIKEERRSATLAAKKFHVSSSNIKNAARLRKEAPDLRDKVWNNRMSISTAMNVLKKRDDGEKKVNGATVNNKFKLLFGEVVGDYGESRGGKWLNDKANDCMETWIGCPEFGVKVSVDVVKDDDGKPAVHFVVTETKGLKYRHDEGEVINKITWTLEGDYNNA